MTASVVDVYAALSHLTPQPRSSPPLPYLHYDIVVTEILSKLPVKSLIRFKVVCKSFKTVISSREFVDLHLRQFGGIRLLINDVNHCVVHSFDLNFTLPATFSWPKPNIKVIGSCNGLFLISFFHPSGSPLISFILLNPATRAYIDLLLPVVPIVGFEFDHIRNDYKIVWNMYKADDNVIAATTTVYSLNSRSWKDVDCSSHPGSVVQNDDVLINNHLLHWMFRSLPNCKNMIRRFDVCTEKWLDDLPIPCQSGSYHHLCVLDGRLVFSFGNRETTCYDVWVMNEYGVQESWFKLLSFNSISDHLCPEIVPLTYDRLGFGELLFWHRSYVWYNLMDNTIKKVEAHDFVNYQLVPYVYKESLVSLPYANLFGDVYESEESVQQQ